MLMQNEPQSMQEKASLKSEKLHTAFSGFPGR